MLVEVARHHILPAVLIKAVWYPKVLISLGRAVIRLCLRGVIVTDYVLRHLVLQERCEIVCHSLLECLFVVDLQDPSRLLKLHLLVIVT